MNALTHLNTSANPFLLKGVKLRTTPTERFPLDQQQLIRWNGGADGYWANFGAIYANAR
jgi:hypothetical protein